MYKMIKSVQKAKTFSNWLLIFNVISIGLWLYSGFYFFLPIILVSIIYIFSVLAGGFIAVFWFFVLVLLFFIFLGYLNNIKLLKQQALPSLRPYYLSFYHLGATLLLCFSPFIDMIFLIGNRSGRIIFVLFNVLSFILTIPGFVYTKKVIALMQEDEQAV